MDTFIVDFEAGMWQGLRDVFEEPQIRGCAFHFGQALFRKVQELGLQVIISNDQILCIALSQHACVNYQYCPKKETEVITNFSDVKFCEY